MPGYRIAVNLEWTSKCNARCVMCPQEKIQHPQLMQQATFEKSLERIKPDEVFRTVIAGYGEPTTHPRFTEYVSDVGNHPGRFDMVSNGQLLDSEKLGHMDGKLSQLIISFSSINPSVYHSVHVNLDHSVVKNNIRLARKVLKKTKLGISLTPLEQCIDTLPETIEWLRTQGVSDLTISPTLYNRGGNMDAHNLATQRLREIIDRYSLHSQELDFVPSIRDSALQYWKNRFKCMPRNSDLFITASGHYLFCYNDISHQHAFSHIDDLSIKDALSFREISGPIPDLCNNCNMRNRYRPGEISRVASAYILSKARQAWPL